MALRAGRRTSDLTRVARDGAVALRRAALGGAIVGAGALLAWVVGGWAWAAGAVVAIPGVTTLLAARHPYVAPCPGCGEPLGGATFVGPDEPVIVGGATDHRCPACGIYVDVSQGVVREVPFGRAHELPTYELALDASRVAELAWGDRCVNCGEAATRWLPLRASGIGILSDAMSPGPEGEVPFCDAHGAEGPSRGVVVARGGARATVQFASYAGYRAFLDANRARVDVRVRTAGSPEG